MLNVYVARSIRGGHNVGDPNYAQVIFEQVKASGHTPATELPPLVGGMSLYGTEDAYICQRDLEWINQCQAMIAEVTNPSLGVGYEIAYAQYRTATPILCVCLKDTRVSAMIRGAGLDFIEYRDTADLRSIVEAWLEDQATATGRTGAAE